MKNVVKVVIASALLTGTLLITSCDINDSISIRYEPKETTAASDTDTVDKPTQDKPPGEQQPEVQQPEEVNYAYKLSSANDIIYVTDGTETRIGVIVEGLKPNTKYRMNWTLDMGVLMNTGAYFLYGETNGTMKPYICVDTKYEAYTNLGLRLWSHAGTYDVLLNGNDGEGFELTTVEDTDSVVVFFFGSAYESADQMASVCQNVFPYITSLTFTELT